MSIHSFSRIWIHLIWGTHNHQRLLLKNIRPQLHEHLLLIAKNLGIWVEMLKIQPEHIHCLIDLPPDHSVSSVAKHLKGESSRWINRNRLIMGKFGWQRGFGVFSVSDSRLKEVKKYIADQEEHHRRVSFSEEYEKWAKLAGYGKGVK